MTRASLTVGFAVDPAVAGVNLQRALVEDLHESSAHVHSWNAGYAVGQARRRPFLVQIGVSLEGFVVVRVELVLVGRVGLDLFLRCGLSFDGLVVIGIVVVLVDVRVAHHVDDVFDFIQG